MSGHERAAIERLLQAGGGNTWVTLADGNPQPRYAGYPVRFVQSMDATTGDASSKVGFLFGSLRKAVAFGQRRDFRVMVDPYTYSARNQVRLISHNRWGVNIHDVGTASAAGAIVALKFAA